MTNNKHKTILWASHSGKASGGGELSMISLVKIAAEMGHTVDIIVPSDNGIVEAMKSAGARNIHIVPQPLWVRGGVTRINDIGFLFSGLHKIGKILRQTKPDVAITNTIVHPWTALAAKSLGIPHIWHIREYGKKDHGVSFIFGERNTFKLVSYLSNNLVTNAYGVKQHVEGYTQSIPITVSYPYVEIPALPKPAKNTTPNLVSLIMVGGITEGKGQLLAVKALESAQKKTKLRLQLTLVGPHKQSYKKEIDNFVSSSSYLDTDSLIYAGLQPNPFDFLVKSDIYLMCSRREAFGRVTVEAMAAGLPVVGLASGGTVEIVKDGETGLLYNESVSDQESANSLAEGIVALAENPKKRKEMGRLAKIRVSQNFSKSSCVDPLFDIISSKAPETKKSRFFAYVIWLLSSAGLIAIYFVKSLLSIYKKIRRRTSHLIRKSIRRTRILVYKILLRIIRMLIPDKG